MNLFRKHIRYTLRHKLTYHDSVTRVLVRPIIAGALTLCLIAGVAATAHQTGPLRLVSAVTGSSDLTISSPIANSYSAGDVTLTASLPNASPDTYDMFWYIDNGAWNWMGTAGSGKQATINVSGWNWHDPSDLYTVSFVAVMHDGGQRVYGSVPIHVGTAMSSAVSTVPTAPTTTASTKISLATASAADLYVNPASSAASSAAATSDPNLKQILTKLANTPTATWFGGWNSTIRADVNTLVSAASTIGQTPVLVAYNIPQRDCGSYSAGGESSPAAYQAWIQQFAAGIGSHSAIVILEPDALAQSDCLSSSDQATRFQLLQYAVTTLKANPNTKVYLDAGNAGWKSASDIANRLNAAGIATADGFSLNVSGFGSTTDNITYGHQISQKVGNKHFVIDTSRNGNGSNGQWCNPSGRALGSAPTTYTGDSSADYFLWIKTPGESDGTCNGGPTAGSWWPSYAENLAENAGW